MKCRNQKCGNEFHRYYPQKEYDQLSFRDNGTYKGIGCYDCGFPKMIIMRSNKPVKDGFKPGFQRNIMKHCATYAEYKAHLKNMGIIEIGYEEIPERQENEPFFNEKVLEMLAKNHNVHLGDHAVESLEKEISKEVS